MKKEVVVTVSGGFDPVHIGHVRLFEAAKKCGDRLIVILNGDSWLVRKKGKYFIGQEERAEIIRAFSAVDDVYVWESEDDDVCGALEIIKPDIFANGGDRKANNIPEYDFCLEHGIEMRFNIGLGGKIQSSSWLLADYMKR